MEQRPSLPRVLADLEAEFKSKPLREVVLAHCDRSMSSKILRTGRLAGLTDGADAVLRQKLLAMLAAAQVEDPVLSADDQVAEYSGSGLVLRHTDGGWKVSAASRRAPDGGLDLEREVARQFVLVFVGQSECHACTMEPLRKAVRDGVDAIGRRAAEKGHGFTAIGVALEESLDAGIEYLRGTSHFDEISVGSGWDNALFAEYRERYDLSLEVPQVLVLERSSCTIAAPGEVADERESRLVVRLSGWRTIVSWASEGARLPDDVTLLRGDRQGVS